MTKVRNAVHEDVDRLLEMTIAFNDEYYDVPINPEKAVAHITHLIEQPIGVVLMTDHGLISGIMVDDPFRDWTVLAETGWYSTKPVQAIRLLEAFEDRGQVLGVDEIRLCTLQSNPGVQRLLARRGYSVIETSHRLLL